MRPLIIIMLSLWSFITQAQVVDTSTTYQLKLKDGTVVTVFSGFAPESHRTYYYLPTAFRLSSNEEGEPEFSFLTFSAQEGQEASGAILHLLLVWGLSVQQEQETNAWLQKNVDSTAVLAGVISLEAPESVPSFNITGEGSLADLLRNRLTRQVVAPLIPGTKIALSYRLNAEETKLFKEAMEKPVQLQKVYFELIFTYRGGNPQYWYNLIKGENYRLGKSLKELLQPVLNTQK